MIEFKQEETLPMRTETSGPLPYKNWFRLWRWLRHDFFGIVTEMRLSYLPPLMVYFAAGVSGFTGIVESFYVKQELGLSAAFLAGLGFWAGLPWALKMPVGHLVDLFWRRKAIFVYIGAILMAASLLIMVGLTGSKDQMARYLAPGTWYVISSLLSPIGFVLQDVVADAMTVEAVPLVDARGAPYPDDRVKLMHTTMQTLGRFAAQIATIPFPATKTTAAKSSFRVFSTTATTVILWCDRVAMKNPSWIAINADGTMVSARATAPHR